VRLEDEFESVAKFDLLHVVWVIGNGNFEGIYVRCRLYWQHYQIWGCGAYVKNLDGKMLVEVRFGTNEGMDAT